MQVKLRNQVPAGSVDNPIARRFGVGYASENAPSRRPTTTFASFSRLE